MSSSRTITMPDLCARSAKYHFVTALNVLLNMGINIERIRLLGEGTYQNYRGEVLHQEPKPGMSVGKDTDIKLRVGFTSAVDYMPYQMFYGITGITSRADNWDENARRLMAPFDGAVIRYKSLAANESLKVKQGLVDLSHLVRFLKLFEFKLWDEKPSVEEALFWSAAMPLFHKWAGNPAGVIPILEYLFRWNFRIVENVSQSYEIPDKMCSRLGHESSRLGAEMVLGASFSECDSTYELRVSGVRNDQVTSLLPGHSIHRKLQWILRLCMPNNLICKMKIVVDRSGLTLGRGDIGRRLGYSTYV